MLGGPAGGWEVKYNCKPKISILTSQLTFFTFPKSLISELNMEQGIGLLGINTGKSQV